MMKKALLVAPLLLLTGCINQPDYRAETNPPDTVATVDLTRYAGRWYEIARYPNPFEDTKKYTCVGVTADYALLPNGKVSVTNTCRKDRLDGEMTVANGSARVVAASNAKLKVRFAPAFVPFAEGDYWILDLMEDYSAALVGDPSGKYLWILSRTPTLLPATYDRMIQSAANAGYDTAPLARVEQTQD